MPATSADPLTDIERIQLAADDHIPDQHVVSKVLLKRFAAKGGPRKRLIVPFNLDYPAGGHQLRGPDGCGKVRNFVPVASRSLELLWKPTEDALHDALLSVDDDTLFEKPAHLATIKGFRCSRTSPTSCSNP
jgi:hypothetical protein